MTSLRTGLTFCCRSWACSSSPVIGIIVGYICLVMPGPSSWPTIWAVAAPAMVVERLDIGNSLSAAPP